MNSRSEHDPQFNFIFRAGIDEDDGMLGLALIGAELGFLAGFAVPEVAAPDVDTDDLSTIPNVSVIPSTESVLPANVSEPSAAISEAAVE